VSQRSFRVSDLWLNVTSYRAVDARLSLSGISNYEFSTPVMLHGKRPPRPQGNFRTSCSRNQCNLLTFDVDCRILRITNLRSLAQRTPVVNVDSILVDFNRFMIKLEYLMLISR